MTIVKHYWRGGMNSLDIEIQEARAQSVMVSEEALTVDLSGDSPNGKTDEISKDSPDSPNGFY